MESETSAVKKDLSSGVLIQANKRHRCKWAVLYGGRRLTLHNVHMRNHFGANMLHQAVQQGDLAKVQAILKLSPKVNNTDYSGCTALHEAALRGQYQACVELIAAGAKVNVRGHSGLTPLHLAVQNKHLQIAELLLKHGAQPWLQGRQASFDLSGDPSLRNTPEPTPTQSKQQLWPTDSRPSEDQDSNVRAAEQSDDETLSITSLPTEEDLLKGLQKELQELLQENLKEELLENLLDDLQEDLQLDFPVDLQAELLDELQVGSEVERQTSAEGSDPFGGGNAALSESPGPQLPWSPKAWPEIRTQRCNKEEETDKQQTVMNSSKDKAGKSSSHANGKSVRKTNSKGETELHGACKRKDLALVKALISSGIDVNCPDFAGWTALHEAAATGCGAVVEALLGAGARANARSIDGDTPLHDAALADSCEVVKLLLQHGANPLDKNMGGCSALDLAKSSEVKDLLRSFQRSTAPGASVLQPHTSTAPPACENVPAQRSPPEALALLLSEVQETLTRVHGLSAAGQMETETHSSTLWDVHTSLSQMLALQHMEKDKLTHMYWSVPDCLRKKVLKTQFIRLASAQANLVDVIQKQVEAVEDFIKLHNNEHKQSSFCSTEAISQEISSIRKTTSISSRSTSASAQSSKVLTAPLVPSQSTKALTAPLIPSLSTMVHTAPLVPSQSTVVLTAPLVPSQSIKALTAPLVRSQSTNILTAPLVLSQSTNVLTAPLVPSQSTNVLTAPLVLSQSTEVLTAPLVPSQSIKALTAPLVRSQSSNVLTAPLVLSQSTEVLTAPLVPLQSTNVLTASLVPSQSTNILTAPLVPSQSTNVLTASLVPSQSTKALTAPLVRSQSTEVLTAPLAPSQSTEVLTAPLVLSQSTNVLTAPLVLTPSQSNKVPAQGEVRKEVLGQKQQTLSEDSTTAPSPTWRPPCAAVVQSQGTMCDPCLSEEDMEEPCSPSLLNSGSEVVDGLALLMKLRLIDVIGDDELVPNALMDQVWTQLLKEDSWTF